MNIHKELSINTNDAVDTRNINNLLFKISGDIARAFKHKPAINAGYVESIIGFIRSLNYHHL